MSEWLFSIDTNCGMNVYAELADGGYLFLIMLYLQTVAVTMWRLRSLLMTRVITVVGVITVV